MKYFLAILTLIIILPSRIFSNDINLILSSEKGITFEFIPKYLSENHFRDEQGRILPLFEDASAPDFKNVGFADYRYKSIPIALPSLTGNTFIILETEFEDIQGVTLKSVPNLIKENGLLVPDDSYSNVDFKRVQIELVKWGEIGIVRDLIIGNLLIYPYQQISDNVVRVYKRIRVQVSFGMPIVELKSRRIDDNIFRGVINEAQAKNWVYDLKSQSLQKVTNSKLSNGNWFRIKITEEGIYKLDFNFLKSKGIDLSNVDPRTIQIFGNGGRALSERSRRFC